LPDAISGQALESITWRGPQVLHTRRRVDQKQLPMRPSLAIRRQAPSAQSIEHLSRLGVAERPDHRANLGRGGSNVNRY
jgi:hypothetical protein